jgi:hypothetical protein
MAFIDAVLEADKQAPRKQRHTAHRIWCRIRTEMPEVEVAESTIRRHVRERKIALAVMHRETFIAIRKCGFVTVTIRRASDSFMPPPVERSPRGTELTEF